MAFNIDEFAKKGTIMAKTKSGGFDIDKFAGTPEKKVSKTQVRQELQLRSLAEEKQDYSIGGFLGNLKSEAGEIVHGIGALLGVAGKAIIHPIETAEWINSPEFGKTMKAIGSSVVSEYKEYKDPVKKFYEEPISVVTDALTIASLGGMAATKIGTAAKIPAAVKAGEALTKVSKPIQLSKDLGKTAISKIPGGNEFLTALEQRSKIADILSKSQQAHLIERNKSLREIDEIIKNLSPEEQQTLIPYVQGQITLPKTPTAEFNKAVELTKKLATQREELLVKAGKLTPEQVLARKWQPVLKQLYGDEGVFDKTEDALAKIEQVKKTFKFSDDPIYVQHIFDDKPKKFADFFVNTAPVKEFKPGFLKKSYGVEGYSIEPKEVLKWQTAQTLKYKNNIELLDRIKNLDFVEPLDDIKNLKPGYKVFAPEGYLRFYQGTIDLVNEFTNKLKATGQLNKVDDLWDSLKEAIDSSMLEKKYLGATNKVQLYQVPEASAKMLSAYAKTTNPYVRLFWDKPVDAFRYLALAMTPRWLVNNVVGNVIFSTIAGDPLSPMGYLTYRTAKKEGLIPDEVFTGMYHTEKLMSGKLGRAGETKIGKAISYLGQKAEDLPILKQVKIAGDFSYKVNEVVDDFFRGAHYVNKATKEAKKKIFQETGKKLTDSIELLRYAKDSPEIMEKAIKSVDDFFYSSSKLSPFERTWMRRALPFYSWYKFIISYGLRLPLNHPKRFEVISNLAKAVYQITGQDQLPNYLKGSVAIGEEGGDIYYLRTSGPSPFTLLEDIATKGVSQTAISSLSPGIKLGVERMTGREAFTGKTYTAKDIIEQYGGRLYRFNPDTGKVEEVEKKVLPNLMEHLLRDFIPQYQLLEQVVAGGAETYTSAGLPSIISGEAIKKTIGGEPKVRAGAVEKLKLRGLGLLGFPISLRTAEQQQTEQESLQKATSQIFYEKFPQMSPQYKRKLKEELQQQILNNVHRAGIIEGLF